MKEYLKGSIFDRDFMQTRARTARVSGKEKLLGHMIGPGFVYAFYCTVLGLKELYYMDIIGINDIFGNPYMYMIITVATTIVGIGTGFFIAHMTERTVCRAGRFRPYILIGTWIMAIAGFFLFWSPFAKGSIAYLIWIFGANILYTCVGLPLYNLRVNLLSVTSRNVLERNNVTTIRSSVTVMISGVVVSLGIVGALYPMVLQRDLSGKSWLITIGVCSLFAIVFSFVDYFWTRERITEDNQKTVLEDTGDALVKVPLGTQMKNLLTNKYYLLALAVAIGAVFYDYLQGGNARVNMITYILGGNAENGLQMIYLMVAMQPMAIGAVVVPILAKRFSARKIMLISSIITLAGVGIALINPYNFGIAVAGGLVFAVGIFAVTNMNAIFMQQASDDIEYRYGYRPEGTLAVGIITTIYTMALTPVGAIYETGLTLNGYVAGAMTQNDAVNTWIIFAYYGAYAIFAGIVLIVCIFFDVEKKMPEIHAGIERRAREAAEARGEVYVSPEEQERLEMEKAAKELEEQRIADLKEKCRKKGLDFETENRKYLEAQTAAKEKKDRKVQKRMAGKKRK